MENEEIEVKLTISKETFNKLEEIVNYYNTYIKFKNKDWDIINLELLIKAAIQRYIEVIEKYNDISEYEEIGRPFKIKNRFKEIMIEKGLKQKDLAELSGLDKSNISTILSNRNQPSLDNFFRLWFAIGCPSLHEVLYRESE